MRRSRLFRTLLVVLGLLTISVARGGEPFRYPEGKHGSGELKYVDGVPVLVVSGTPEEIGEQSALLAVKPAGRMLSYPEDILKALLQPRVPALIYPTALKSAWLYFSRNAEAMEQAFPDDYRKEVEALIKTSGFDRAQVLVGNTMFDA